MRAALSAGSRSPCHSGATAQPASIDGLVERLDKGEFDLVAVGRALLVDPEWAVKVREGRSGDIKPFSREALASLV